MRQVGGKLEHGDWRSKLARFGLGAKGLLYLALGTLAVRFAAGSGSSHATSKRGAIELVASQPFGQVLLGILTAGLFALAIWRLLLAFTGDPVEGDGAKERVKFGAQSLIYFATAAAALTALLTHIGASGGGGSGGGSGSGGKEDEATATVLSWPGGQWIVAVFGLVLAGVAVQQIQKHGLHHRFMERVSRARMRPKVERVVQRSGQAGHTARGIVLGIVGCFLVVAAIQHDPQQAMGLSGALRFLAQQAWGQIVLWVVALGLVLYGVWCFGEARYRRAT